MYVEALHLNIENIDKYTREEIKGIYKKIALECHPDKLTHVSDEVERNAKIERFKMATIGYKKAMEDFENYGKLNYRGTEYNFDNLADDYEIYNSFDLNFWKNTYDGIFKDKDKIKSTFIDVASYFFNRGFKNKNHYEPSTKIVKHNINLPISYYDLCSQTKRKLRILLKNVKEPVYITLCCKNDYPCLTRQYIDDDSIEHEIIIQMILESDDEGSEADGADEAGCNGGEAGETDGAEYVRYTHTPHTPHTEHTQSSEHPASHSHRIDLHTAIDINIVEYLSGGIRKIRYVDDSLIDVPIEPFSTKDIVIEEKGLRGGNLNVKVVFHNITLKKWKKISEKKRARVIHLLAKMYP
jgi:DnaJ-class molecular chaperone